jgi:transcriptional regulator with XRE-family HTH domain
MTGAELRNRRRALGIRPAELAGEVQRSERWLYGLEQSGPALIPPWAETQIEAAFRRIHTRRGELLQKSCT